ncbi:MULTISPECIES: hypothetical protein [unclassified Oceanispirochaeta]|uniref:hypothetical protein n=1 Tax=unclassified Oceanispirochaeta TaxID=2635722 RepID=UPI000E095F18|nr:MULTISPECIES: hypothetical protein [unclassified Oceanispirochaeta]MBF9014589.1 hypothetical protein [Oceanispirochaeta sp. M2]NPD70845.1 hypothetical protein [Oceanispirochaeta sp. M1]RDG34126.1 hypothetical protein DV872_01925 [Oceanispirochaeta sp. M1]
MSQSKNSIYLSISLISVLFISSCASTQTFQQQYVEASESVSRRDFQGASTIIESHKEESYKEKDRVLYFLDVGMLYHYSGEYEKSNAALDNAERGIEELYSKSISKAITSGILNDNALEYAGEDYEDIYLNVFKGLNYIALGDEESAMIEIKRVHIKLNILEDKYRSLIEEYNDSSEAEGQIEALKNRFHNDVLARYLGLLLYRYENSPDSARIERDYIKDAFLSQSHLYDFDIPELPELENDSEMARLSVLAFSGVSPRKVAETFYLDTVKNGVFITSVSQNEEYIKSVVGFNFLLMPGIGSGYHFKFEYPRMEQMHSKVNRIVLLVDGVPVKELPLIENMERISREIFLIKQPLVIGKSILRTVTKGIVKETGKTAVNDSMSDDAGGMVLGILIGFAADVAVDATENADLRISQYFPAYAHSIDFALPPGEHDVSIEYYKDSTLIFRDQRGSLNLQSGELNFVESYVLE